MDVWRNFDHMLRRAGNLWWQPWVSLTTISILSFHLCFVLPGGQAGVLALLAVFAAGFRKIRVHTEILIFVIFLHSLLYGFDRSVESRDRYPPSSPFGLVELRVPLTDNNDGYSHVPKAPPDLDIIFVHGLASNPDTTWCGSRPTIIKTNTTNSDDSVTQTLHVDWISEFLLEDLGLKLCSRARFFFFNYNSYWLRDSRQVRLRTLADKFLAGIRRNNPGLRTGAGRQIIFVAHSYGGLVVKQALVNAKDDEQYAGVVTAVIGIIFLGTPHAGTSLAPHAARVANVLRSTRDANPMFVNQMQEGSPTLLDLHKQFIRLYGNIAMANFFEEKKMWIVKWLPWRELIVNEQSATFFVPAIQGSHGVRNFGLDLDHSGLNKFSSRTHDYSQIVSELKEMIPKQVKFAAPTIFVSTWLPVQLLGNYVSRENLSAQLHEKLCRPSASRFKANSVTLYGMGGSGKTQLALDYLETHGHEYSFTFWINGRDETSTRASFESIFRQLNLNPVIHTSQENAVVRLADLPVVRAVLQRLQNPPRAHESWLVVVDDVNDFTWGIRDVLPRGASGSILITSQDTRSTFLLGGEELEIGAMEREEALHLLLGTSEEQYQHLRTGVRQRAEKIIETLGCLPLAVDLARAYIFTSAKAAISEQNLQHYLDQLNSHRRAVLSTNPLEDMTSYDKTIATVWDTTFDLIRRTNTSSTQLLALLAYLNRDYLTDEIFALASIGLDDASPTYLDSLPQWLLNLISHNTDHKWDQSDFRKALQPLLNYNMVRIHEGGNKSRYYMHGLLQWRAQISVNETEWATLAFRFIALAIHGQRLKNNFGEDLHPHITTIVPLLPAHPVSHNNGALPVDMAVEYHEAAVSYHHAGHYDQARQMQCMAIMPVVEMYKISGDPTALVTDIRFLRIFHSMAMTDVELKKYDDAADSLEMVAKQISEALPRMDPEGLEAWSNLAKVFTLQGLREKAEDLHVQLFITSQYWLQPTDRITLKIRYQLAISLDQWGQWEDAVNMLVGVMEVQEHVFGPEDEDTISTKEYLAKIFHSQHRPDEAEILEAQALAWRLKYKPNDPVTLRLLSQKAWQSVENHSWAEAERLFELFVRNFPVISYEIHAIALQSRLNLAYCIAKQNRPIEAEQIIRSVLGAKNRAQEWSECQTGYAFSMLSRALEDQGRLKEAENYLVDSLDSTKLIRHCAEEGLIRSALFSRLGLLQLRQRLQRKLPEAKAAFQSAIDLRSEDFGERDHLVLLWQKYIKIIEEAPANPNMMNAFVDGIDGCYETHGQDIYS